MATYEEMTRNILRDNFVHETLNQSNLSSEEKYGFIRHIVSIYSGLKRHPYRLYYKDDLPTDYVCLDIETTGLTRNDKVTQIAGVKVVNDTIVDTFESYVNIGDTKLPIQISYLTGITEEMLEYAPSFNDVADSLIEFVDGLSLIGHNITSFDLPFLARNGLDLRNLLAVDTVGFAKASPLGLDNHKLETLMDYYGINTTAHNALNDSLATVEIYNALKNKDYRRRTISEDFPQIWVDTKFAYTGSFANFTRKTLENQILSFGGTISKSVTKTTDFLVVGQQIAKNLTDGVRSSKEIKCMEMIDDGHPIKMITEEEFLHLLQEAKN